MAVDAHHHLWDLDVREVPWLDDPALAPVRRDFGAHDLHAALKGSTVDATVLVQNVADPEETPEMLVLADSVDRIAGVVGWVDLTARDCRQRIGALLSHPSGRWLKGFRHQVAHESDPDWLIRPDVLNGLAAVEAAGLVYELLVHPAQLPAAIKAVSEFPQLTFVLDHCGKPDIAGGEWEPWAGLVRKIAGYPNVVCKLSGLITRDDPERWRGVTGRPHPATDRLRPYAETVFEAFGAGRVMFGSDWPVCEAVADYAQVLRVAHELTEGLDCRQRTAIFDTTARQIYEI